MTTRTGAPPTPNRDARDPRIVVTHGGTPSRRQLAALVAALVGATAARPDDRADPPWARAARLEGAGAARVADPAALAVGAARLDRGRRATVPAPGRTPR